MGGTKKKTEGEEIVAPGAFKIAYFELDSIENNFEKVKVVKKEIADKDEHYNSEVAKLEMKMNRRVQGYQQKQNSGTMTEQDYVNAQADLKRLETELKGEKQLLDNNYQEFVLRRNLDVRKEIEDYIAKYNKEKGYSYVIAYEPGLFYFRDTLYNITSDLLTGLNEEYKKKN
ncbi:MAG: OmpH family outer membrane protein [Chitinophagaceae bacterium]|nr:OmpH family outer membrane protein [Chitinophagaceae bacterium]